MITLEEHFIFRRKGGPLGGYNLDDWDTPSKYVSVFGCLAFALINDLQRLPLGIAGILAGAIGVAGAVVGMAEVRSIVPYPSTTDEPPTNASKHQVWYIGPIGILAGNPEFGGDLGFEVRVLFHQRQPTSTSFFTNLFSLFQLAAIFAGVSYPFLRWLEIRLVGR